MNYCPKKERRGLKAFSAMILSILQKERAMDYTRVSDVIIAMTGNTGEDKNIKRRIYDALNVMCAVDIVRKDKKMVYLIDNTLCECASEIDKRLLSLGHATTSTSKLRERIEEKERHLEDVLRRKDLLLQLIERNKEKEETEDKEKLHFPFIIISTGKKSRIDCETNDKRSYFKFIFANEYKIYEDVQILKEIFKDVPHTQENYTNALMDSVLPETPLLNTLPDAYPTPNDWLSKLPQLEDKQAPSNSNYIFTEEDDWLNIYNFLS
ncbi:transcription factor Dp-1 [Nematocida displodere]|uniref:Transcription factor Dp-1 n=1 Tax=Nematocida displodere TaxID=1805483 RepID=A0A177EAS3_9MICR|nr:transcription factor Dp-1 [Nematocida displodere]